MNFKNLLLLFLLSLSSFSMLSQNGSKVYQDDKRDAEDEELMIRYKKVTDELGEIQSKTPQLTWFNCDDEANLLQSIEANQKRIDWVTQARAYTLCEEMNEIFKLRGLDRTDQCSWIELAKEQSQFKIDGARKCLNDLRMKSSDDDEDDNELTIIGVSNETTQITSQQKNIQDNPESIYTKRQQEADRARRAKEAQRKAREEEVKRRVVVSQQQYEQTMANNQQAKNVISDVFEGQYQRIQNEQEKKWQEIENQRDREWEASQRREEEQRRKIAEEKRIKNAKSKFSANIPDVKIPLFFDQPKAYVLFVGDVGNETIKIIPAVLNKNTNNQLPFQIDVIKKIKVKYNLANLKTSGIYSKYEQLQAHVHHLIKSAQNNYINVYEEKKIEFGRKQTENDNNEDFWGNKNSKTKPESKKKDDFWN